MSLVGCESAEVRGFVRDAETGEPLPGATIIVEDEAVVTDADGYYRIRVEDPGDPHHVHVERAGYAPVSGYVAIVEGVEVVGKDIHLYRRPGREEPPAAPREEPR